MRYAAKSSTSSSIVIRELEEKRGIVVDRDALRARSEQEIGFADYGKYWREQFIEGLRQLERKGVHIETPEGSVLWPADMVGRLRRRFPEAGTAKRLAPSTES